MALMNPATRWFQEFQRPFQWFERATDDYELYEDGDEYVLTIDMQGFEPEDVDLRWDEGLFRIAAEHEHDDEAAVRTKTYHRSFRMPKGIDPEEIDASYTNGVLEVRLPIVDALPGKRIEVGG